MHITAWVYINDDERGLLSDYGDWLEQLALHEPVSQHLHNRTAKITLTLIYNDRA